MNLTFDPLFKAFMLSDNTKHYKAELFSLITGIPEEAFLDAKYTCEELKINRENEKVFKTDIIIKLNKVIVSLEMNNKKYDWIMERNLDYLAKLKGEELESQETYQDGSRMIQINFNNFHISRDPRVIQKYMFLNSLTKEVLTESFIIYNIDLLNLKKTCYNEDVTRLENLLTIFVTEKLDFLRGDENMDEAIDEIEKLREEKGIIGLYDAKKVEEKMRRSELEELREKSMKKGLRQGLNKGLKQGIEEGKKQGIEEGKKQGIEEGKKQGIEQGIEQVAKNMLNNNFSIDEISKITGLSIKEIEELRKA